jgi:hypothetical protein
LTSEIPGQSGHALPILVRPARANCRLLGKQFVEPKWLCCAPCIGSSRLGSESRFAATLPARSAIPNPQRPVHLSLRPWRSRDDAPMRRSTAKAKLSLPVYSEFCRASSAIRPCSKNTIRSAIVRRLCTSFTIPGCPRFGSNSSSILRCPHLVRLCPGSRAKSGPSIISHSGQELHSAATRSEFKTEGGRSASALRCRYSKAFWQRACRCGGHARPEAGQRQNSAPPQHRRRYSAPSC